MREREEGIKREDGGSWTQRSRHVEVVNTGSSRGGHECGVALHEYRGVELGSRLARGLEHERELRVQLQRVRDRENHN